MIDGMSVYRYGFAQVDWTRLAIDIADIERVEVTRSPSAASYGSNAFQVVVNFITKHPSDTESFELISERGSENTERHYARYSGSLGPAVYSASISKQNDSGFDLVEFDNFKEPVPGAVDGINTEKFLVRSEIPFSSHTYLELRFGGVRADLEEEEVDPNQLAPPRKRQEDWHIHSSFNHIFNNKHHVKIHASIRESDYDEEWRACNPAVVYLDELRDLSSVNSELAWGLLQGEAVSGENDLENQLLQDTLIRIGELGSEAFQPLCGLGNQDIFEKKTVFEVEDTYQASSQLRFNTGIGYQKNIADSETYSNGKVDSIHRYLFSNMEYLLSHLLTLNAGFIYEEVSNIDENVFSPRLGLNYHYLEKDTIRFVYSSAKRLPNILETDREWNYFVRDWDITFDGRNEGYFFLTSVSPESLKPEKIDSLEVGFYGSHSSLEYDARIFREWLRDLISEKGTFLDFNLSNNSKVDLTGFELESSYKWSPNLKFSIGYSYIDTDYSSFFEQTLHSDHGGFGTITHHSTIGTFSLAYYGNSAMSGESYDRWDVTYSGLKHVNGSVNINLRISASYIGNNDHAYQFRIDNRAIHSYDNTYRIKAQIGISL